MVLASLQYLDQSDVLERLIETTFIVFTLLINCKAVCYSRKPSNLSDFGRDELKDS